MASFSLNRSIVTKKIIDIFIIFLKENFAKSRLYENTKISDRYSLTASMTPCIIVRNTSNNQKRIDFHDFVEPIYAYSELIPIQADDNLVGNNIQRVNLPATVDWNPVRPYDQSIPLPSGTDINVTIFTSGTAPFDQTTMTTGIIITVPSSNSFQPTSLVYATDLAVQNGTTSPLASVISGANYNMSIGFDLTNEQFYLMYSGTGISGVQSVPINPDDYLVNPIGIPSGTAIKVNDVLFAGDQYQFNIYPNKTYIADRFGGIYNSTLNFDCYADTTLETQELSDLVERFLVEKKFDIENVSGVHLTSWSMGGQSEQPHLSNWIFSCSVSCECWIEWFDIRGIGLISGITNTTIPVGTYWINTPLSLSGTTLFNTQSINSVDYFTTSGTVTLPLSITSHTDILNVFSGSSLTSGIYPTSSIGLNGAGWYQSGTSIVFTNGSFTNFQSGASANQIPASGTNFYITFAQTILVDPSGIYNHEPGQYQTPGVTTADTTNGNSIINTLLYPTNQFVENSQITNDGIIS